MTAIVILGRAPVPGQCKTRLGRHIGAQRAAWIHHALMLRTIRLARQSHDSVALFCTPNCNHPVYSACRREYGIRLELQHGKDLGLRMYSAATKMLRQQDKVIILGTDAIDLSAATLEAASKQLDQYDVVIAPSSDGGYVLIGLTQAQLPLFENIQWGSSRVLSQTLRNARKIGQKPYLMETHHDVDTLQDLKTAINERHLSTDYLRIWNACHIRDHH